MWNKIRTKTWKRCGWPRTDNTSNSVSSAMFNKDVERPMLNKHIVHVQQVSQETGPGKVSDLLRQFG